MIKDKKVLVGVTGRAGAGKSTFARLLTKEGMPGLVELIEADPLAWKLYARPEIRERLAGAFGNGIFDAKGELDRKSLAEVVFRDRKKLEALNSIIHPPLLEELDRRIRQSRTRVVIFDAALLLDWPIAERCSIRIAVLARKSISMDRLLRKGSSEERAKAILSNQRPAGEFRKLCDVIVTNDGSLEELRKKAKFVWKKNVAPLLLRVKTVD